MVFYVMELRVCEPEYIGCNDEALLLLDKLLSNEEAKHYNISVTPLVCP